MSSSSRDLIILRRAMRAAAVLLLLASGAVSAQQVVFIPELQAWAQYDSNRLLNPVNAESAETYWVQAAADMKRITQRSDLEFRPQLTLQDSSINSVNRWEALVDLKGDYRTLRSVWSIMAEYHREDAARAEDRPYTSPLFNARSLLREP